MNIMRHILHLINTKPLVLPVRLAPAAPRALPSWQARHLSTRHWCGILILLLYRYCIPQQLWIYQSGPREAFVLSDNTSDNASQHVVRLFNSL